MWIFVASWNLVKGFWYPSSFSSILLCVLCFFSLCWLYIITYDRMDILSQVGSFARGLFLVHSECLESNYIASRPFRVNAVSCLSCWQEYPDDCCLFASFGIHCNIQSGSLYCCLKHGNHAIKSNLIHKIFTSLLSVTYSVGKDLRNLGRQQLKMKLVDLVFSEF